MTIASGLEGIQCKDCGFRVIELSISCPSCGSDHIEPVLLKETGTIYTFTIVHVGFGHMAERAPYVLAIIKTDDDLKLTTILEDLSDFDSVAIGKKVRYKRTDEKIGPIFQLV
ncbi:Zn-ribbon domain-containing OB-fold protein [Leptospira ilyithenensis]|uniref:ChsH2 C-terminal OB-fold domain-containing protein n=1 Tax=Leptospira ilyithenensis TaxID=2484901 RepID=A0A4R9LRY3_9LEPT|nr:OB-fold domain-containing protein [Leptospira ilyithenensis]TGN10908.1 hypothetical protein EHS11_06910 [Leptospira ilyithenensis]